MINNVIQSYTLFYRYANYFMAKTLKSFRLSDEAIKALEKLAKADDRSEAYIVEKLIVDASKKAK